MSLFQKSVTNKYLKNLDTEKVDKAFENFQKFYGNKLRLANIMQLKEENYQEGFLREIFVETLGYIINPDENYNLTTEFKNQKDARKADGAIIDTRGHAPLAKAIGVIELKSTKTKNLESIKEQAFGYKNNQPDCKYVITSNFQSLRFYVDNATEYEEFNLFHLDKKQFKLLYLLLSKESIFSGLPEKLKKETKFHENNISAQLYADYKHFKDKIFENLVKNNLSKGHAPLQVDKLTLFKKSQKLLDRFLFIFFAEDSGLIPPNAVSKIVEQWKDLQELDEYKPLYSRFQKLFSHLDKGHIYKKWGEIPAYNGGLFRDDEILDSDKIKIDDEILEKDSLKLSAYDFNTEVDVNILGHIFEHSLNEIEEITAELSATRGHAPLSIPKSVSKRKKDGVFYTPKYITKYIVENTVGTLCNEKKEELQIEQVDASTCSDETYRKKDGKLNEKGKKLFKILHLYKDWLITLKILDPACGSGAFLNQTLDFLIAEHKQTDDLIAELTGENLRLFDTDKSILENNIYGVDINEESVEIAKLSLWLRTAQRGRKLSDLSGNIKCGNSLIDDPKVAGDKAFNWHFEFSQIFKEKQKTSWHITTATHNSRYSQRMFDNHVKLGKAIWLSEKEEMIVSQTLADIVKNDNLNIPAYNICGDHMHMILVCEEKEMPKIVGKIKAMTARACNIAMGRTIPATKTTDTPVSLLRTRGHAPLSDTNTDSDTDTDTKRKRGKAQASLWTQKFGKKRITDNRQYNNTINYIRNNRKKHELTENYKLQKIIESFVCTTKYAFRKEYKGGFDVVLGNPPYVRLQGLKANYEKESHFYEQKYQAATANYDIYALFIEKSFQLIKHSGKVGFILPHKFLISEFGKGIRNYLSENKAVERLVHFGSEMVFADASTYTCILTLSKNNKKLYFQHINPLKLSENYIFDEIDYSKLNSAKWNLNNQKISTVLEKLNKKPLRVKDVFAKIFQGIATSGDNVYLIKGEQQGNYIKGYSKAIDRIVKLEAGLVKPMLKGEDISKYKYLENQYFVIFPYLIENGKASPMTEEYIRENFPLGYKYLKENETFLRGRERGRMNKEGWFLYIYPKSLAECENKDKIVAPDILLGMNLTYDTHGYCVKNGAYGIVIKPEYRYLAKLLLAFLNSSLMWFFLKNTSSELRGGYFRFNTKFIEPFPLPKLKNISEQNIFIEKADLMLSLNKELQTKVEKFIKRIKANLPMGHAPLTEIKISKKLQNFYDFDFKTFLKEVNKLRKSANKGTRPLGKQTQFLSLIQQDEWEDYFDNYKTEINNIQNLINQTDKKIDKMVYELYELTAEEIEIVENSIK